MFSSLTKLCTRLSAKDDVFVTPQALDNRFNKGVAEFMKNVFNEMMLLTFLSYLFMDISQKK